MRILFFGDSITQGFFDLSGGWVQRIRTQYEKSILDNLDDDWPEVFNLGISGDTADGVAKRLAIETGARRLLDDQIVIVVAIGLNDTVFRGEEKAATPDLYKGFLQQIVASARQYTNKMLFVGLTAVDDEMCNPWKYSDTGKCFSNERILQFEKVLREFCDENDLPLVEVYEAFQGKRIEENLLADGLHPNEAGHQLIAELVKPKLDELTNKI